MDTTWTSHGYGYVCNVSSQVPTCAAGAGPGRSQARSAVGAASAHPAAQPSAEIVPCTTPLFLPNNQSSRNHPARPRVIFQHTGHRKLNKKNKGGFPRSRAEPVQALLARLRAWRGGEIQKLEPKWRRRAKHIKREEDGFRSFNFLPTPDQHSVRPCFAARPQGSRATQGPY